MSVQWLSNCAQGSVTIYETNITLNTVACSNFKNAYAALIGFDSSDKSLLIKALSKEEATAGRYTDQDLHPISIKPSYGRINGKGIIKSLCEFYPLNFADAKLHKFKCEWVSSQKFLKVFLEEEVK